jgi:hypothetical protein
MVLSFVLMALYFLPLETAKHWKLNVAKIRETAYNSRMRDAEDECFANFVPNQYV